MLVQISDPLAVVIAAGAYNCEPVYRAVAERQSDPPAVVAIPPRSIPVLSTNAKTAPSQRDRYIELIRVKDRKGWEQAAGCGRRSLGKTATFRHKDAVSYAL